MASILLLSIGLKEAHHFHAHDDTKHCNADGQEHHFHGEEYAFHDCMLCHLNYSEQQFTPKNKLILSLPEYYLSETTYFYLPYFSNDRFNFTTRGPPLV